MNQLTLKIIDLDVANIVYGQSQYLSYNKSTTSKPDICLLSIQTPHIYLHNKNIIDPFINSTIRLPLYHTDTYSDIEYEQIEQFKEKIVQIEKIISTDDFKQLYFGTRKIKYSSSVSSSYIKVNIPCAYFEYTIKDEVHYKKNIPDKFRCAITQNIPIKPVLFDKHVYEYDAINEWLEQNYTSPLTRRSHDEHGLLLKINELSVEELEEINSYKKTEVEFESDDEITIKEETIIESKPRIKMFEKKNNIREEINIDNKQIEDFLQHKMKIRLICNISIHSVNNYYRLMLKVRAIEYNKD